MSTCSRELQGIAHASLRVERRSDRVEELRNSTVSAGGSMDVFAERFEIWIRPGSHAWRVRRSVNLPVKGGKRENFVENFLRGS